MVLSAPSESVRSECESADRLRGKVAERLPPEMEGIAAGPLEAAAVAEFLLPNSSESVLNTLKFLQIKQIAPPHRPNGNPKNKFSMGLGCFS